MPSRKRREGACRRPQFAAKKEQHKEKAMLLARFALRRVLSPRRRSPRWNRQRRSPGTKQILERTRGLSTAIPSPSFLRGRHFEFLFPRFGREERCRRKCRGSMAENCERQLSRSLRSF